MEKSVADNIKSVRRIKDDGIFTRYMPIDMSGREENYDAFYITNFHDDMKTVDWEIHQIGIGITKGSSVIDYIFMSEDFKLINIIVDKKLNRKNETN